MTSWIISKDSQRDPAATEGHSGKPVSIANNKGRKVVSLEMGERKMEKKEIIYQNM